MQVDDEIRDFLHKNNMNDKSAVLGFGKAWGESTTTVPLSAKIYFYGLISEDKTAKRIGSEIFQSFVYTGFITVLLKSVIGRARPYKNHSSTYYQPLNSKNDFNSLPSGHTSIAFSLSTVLADNLDNEYLKALAFTPAFITAFSRISYDKHWLSDVFLGSAVVFFEGCYVHDLHAEISLHNETNLWQKLVINRRFIIN